MLSFWIINLLIFPGVVVHEMSHKFFCDWAGVKVLKVCYFRFGNPSGYVIHEEAQKFTQSLFITMGPLIIGTIIATLLFILQIKHPRSLYGFIFLWLGLSIAANSFPSRGDAKALYSETKRHAWKNPLAIVGFPIALSIWAVSLLGFLWINVVYAFLLFGFVNYWGM